MIVFHIILSKNGHQTLPSILFLTRQKRTFYYENTLLVLTNIRSARAGNKKSLQNNTNKELNYETTDITSRYLNKVKD